MSHSVIKLKWEKKIPNSEPEVRYSIHLNLETKDKFFKKENDPWLKSGFKPADHIEYFEVNEEIFWLLTKSEGLWLEEKQTV